MRKICVFVGSRANYSSVKSVMSSIRNHPKLELQLVLGASSLLEKYGKVETLIKKDGFIPDYSFYNIVEGENPTTMAKSTGLGIIEMAMVLDNLKPDFLFVVGDRFEMMAVTIAAAYMNIRIAHSMGGEVTGTIDESIRHAITKFAHIHFPANDDARKRIIKLGEDEKYVFNFGCPRIDLIKEELKMNSYELINNSKLFKTFKGVGGKIDVGNPFLLVSQHPVTTEFGSGRIQIKETLSALKEINMNTIMLWPNVDAGSDDISKEIRTFRENYNAKWLHVFINLPTNIYIHLMNTTVCLIGNSSSGIREGAFIGTPVVNIGTRQQHRMRSENVIDVSYSKDQIIEAIKKQINHGKYIKSTIYGTGNASVRIADTLYEVDPKVQKTITF